MNYILKAATCRLHVFFCAGLLSATAVAQGTGSVVESQPFTLGQSRPINAAQVVPNNDAMSLLLDQIRDLQSEVQSLRAMVEEQSFELRKMQRDSLSRYTNVDERLSSLESGAAAATASNIANDVVNNAPANRTPAATNPSTRALGNAPASIPGAVSNNRPGATGLLPTGDTARAPTTRNIGRGTLQPAVLSEQQLYQMAYDSVINSNFDLSIAEFDQYLSVYPQGRFVSNAHYWKGQAYLYLNRYNEAVESYEMIINQQQESAKLPDAMYGLALAYEGMGNNSQARRLLNDIRRRFPNTGVANLADTRLLSLD
ncbi:MAG: tol-pal system protein YbgF [Pseudohongiellaceae bacterium]